MNRMRIAHFARASLAVVAFLWLNHPCEAGGVVLPAGSSVAGKSIGEWSAESWKWSFSFAMPDDPFTDATGANANLGQSGPVFFIAGNVGQFTERNFTVPVGVYLLLPLLSGELSQLEIGFDKTAAEVRQAAKDQADLIDALHATINGVDVPDLFGHREVSPDFQFTAVAGNAIGVPAGDSGIAVADGYWLMLTPLSLGEQLEIRFGGGLSTVGFSVDAISHITAVPEPSTFTLIAFGAATVVSGGLYRRKRMVG